MDRLGSDNDDSIRGERRWRGWKLVDVERKCQQLFWKFGGV